MRKRQSQDYAFIHRRERIARPARQPRPEQAEPIAPAPVVCIDCDTLHRFGSLQDSHFRLRYRTFIEQRYWGGVSSFRGREFDQYDNPAAHYLVRPSPDGTACGCLRVSPTDRPYMLKDNWPEMCSIRLLPESMSTWEVTRLCVDQSLPRETRRQVKNELICGLVEFALRNDVRQLIAVTHPKLWQSVFIHAGWDVEFLGNEKLLDDGPAQAGMVWISTTLLGRVRKALGIDRSVLQLS